MTWIALKMLTGDRPKFLGIVLGLTFAALLITQQGSIFCGLMLRTAGQIQDITGADLWVMDPNVRYVDDVKPMIENNLYRVRGVEGIEWAVPLYKGNARAKLNSKGIDPETKQPRTFQVIEQVILLGLDDTSMVGAPPPERVLAGSLEDLRQPDSVMVDFTRLRKLYPGEAWDEEPTLPGMLQGLREGVGRLMHRAGLIDEDPARLAEDDRREARRAFYARFLGRDLEMNDRRGHIVAVCEATRTFQSNAVVYTTYSRAKLFVPRERKILSYVLAKVEGTDRPGLSDEEREGLRERAATQIARQTGLRARTSQQFLWDTIDYYMKYTGIPINFGITAMLGFIVGTAIAGQTFYNFTLDNLKQFGALKAMGASNLRIVGMILLQATVTGLLGYGIGVGLAAFFGRASQGGELAFYTPWQLLPISGAAVVTICLLASLVCVRRVVVLEPAVVFGLTWGMIVTTMTATKGPIANALAPKGAEVAVRIRGVSKSFGKGDQRVLALRGIDWDVYPGQMTMIVGPSGCGKTTLLSVIAGILDADEGVVEIFGHDVTRMSDGQKTRFRAHRIGFVFQQYNLLPALTAAENAAIPLVIAGWRRGPAVARAVEVLEGLGMGPKVEKLPSQLSGGQQQRVAIARALVHEPSLLVCDEPTAALDHETGLNVMELLRGAAVRPDRAVVVVTHDNRVFHFGDRIAHMDDGAIVQVEDKAVEPAA